MFKKILLAVLLVAGFGFSGEYYINNYYDTYWFKQLVAWKTNLSMMYIKNDLIYVIKKENNNSCWYERYNENSTSSKFLISFQKNKFRVDYAIEYDSTGKAIDNSESSFEIFDYIIPGSVGEEYYKICRDAKNIDYLAKISAYENNFTKFSIKYRFFNFDSLYKFDSTKSISGINKYIKLIKYNYDDIRIVDFVGDVHVYKFSEDSCTFDTTQYSEPKYFYKTSYSINGKIERNKEMVNRWTMIYNDVVNLFKHKKDKYHKSNNSCSELFYTQNK